LIRLGTPDDFDALRDLAYDCVHELPNPAGPWNEDQIGQQIQVYLSPSPVHVTFLAVDDRGAFGALVGFAAPVFYTGTAQAYELFWYVRPTHRKHRDGLRLFKVYEKWAEKIGCSTIQCSMVHGWLDVEAFYLRNGYIKTETSYRKYINGY
jgi:GNAT superfamily N-acetyltransferase